MTDRNKDLEPLDRADLAALEAPEPPSGFADRVLAARKHSADAAPSVEPEGVFPFAQRSRPARGSWKWTALVAALGCAAAVFLTMRRGASLPDASGSALTTDRQTIRLGHRGVAVAEAGTSLSWQVAGRSGEAVVAQKQGHVFYRVDRGGSFAVELPGARIDVAGTCFSVEVIPMTKPSRSALTGAAVGALAAATLVVTVYEGRLLFADDKSGTKELRAGDTAVRGPGQAIAVRRQAEPGSAGAGAKVAVALRPAPAADVTRDQLLKRDEEQRSAIASLQGKVAMLERDLLAARKAKRSGKGADDDGRPWFDPSVETLQRFAKECRVRYDSPPIMGAQPFQVSKKMAARMGLEESDLGTVNKVLAKLHSEFVLNLRKLYIEATGDSSGVESLSPSAMANEIRDKSPKGALARIQQQIARERAGLAQAPADWSKAIPLERYYRLLGAMGDEMEKELGARVGTERARAMREKNNGWGRRMEYAGCPEDDDKTMDVER